MPEPPVMTVVLVSLDYRPIYRTKRAADRGSAGHQYDCDAGASVSYAITARGVQVGDGIVRTEMEASTVPGVAVSPHRSTRCPDPSSLG
jgi:hypothetical protein